MLKLLKMVNIFKIANRSGGRRPIRHLVKWSPLIHVANTPPIYNWDCTNCVVLAEHNLFCIHSLKHCLTKPCLLLINEAQTVPRKRQFEKK